MSGEEQKAAAAASVVNGSRTKDSDAVPRFKKAQQNRTIIYPTLSQTDHCPTMMISSNKKEEVIIPNPHLKSEHSFVICADTQFGMTRQNRDWSLEMKYSRIAVKAINGLRPRPLFCIVCGDLVDMTEQLFAGKVGGFTSQDCHEIQTRQYADFSKIWRQIHPDICLVCVCGNHDVGNRPSAASIERFTNVFGNDYLAFWANGTYNLVVNTNLFADPTLAMDLYNQQLVWMENRLEYATQQQARQIFVFGHHPWFLYNEHDTNESLTGESHLPPRIWQEDNNNNKKAASPEVVVAAAAAQDKEPKTSPPLPIPRSIADSYFVIPIEYRKAAMALFQRYKVAAAFSGHFHQNWLARSTFGMDMIVTGSLSVVLETTAPRPKEFVNEPNTRGYRIVTVTYNNEEKDDDAAAKKETVKEEQNGSEQPDPKRLKTAANNDNDGTTTTTSDNEATTQRTTTRGSSKFTHRFISLPEEE